MRQHQQYLYGGPQPALPPSLFLLLLLLGSPLNAGEPAQAARPNPARPSIAGAAMLGIPAAGAALYLRHWINQGALGIA